MPVCPAQPLVLTGYNERKGILVLDHFHCSLMWIKEDAFYPGSYFKETSNAHPKRNVAAGIAQVFFFLFFFFFVVFLILDTLVQAEQRIPEVQTSLEALASFLKY